MSSLVFTNGCFDLLHEGHKYLLTKAAEYGRLVVGINSDDSVKRLKGPGRPIWDQEKRKKEILKLGCAAIVFIFEEDTPQHLINTFREGIIIVKGGDYKPKDVVGYERASEVVIIPLLEGYSTTKMIEDMYE